MSQPLEKCPYTPCLGNNPPSYKFCGTCGKPLTVKCPNPRCRSENPVSSKYCGSCCTLLFTSSQQPARQPTTPQRNLTAQDYYEKAKQVAKEKLADMGETPEQIQKKRSDLLHVASYYRLALDHSRGNYPDASAQLALIMLLLNDLPKAKQYAQMTISQEPNNFYALYVFFGLACSELEAYQPHVDSSSWTGLFLTGGWTMLQKSGKHGNVTTAARNLVAAFQYNVQSGTKRDAEEWLDMAEQLLNVGEVLNGYKMRDPAIFQAVMNAPWDKIELGEYASKVMDLRAKAEGLMRL